MVWYASDTKKGRETSMSSRKLFDLNCQAMPDARRLTPESNSLTARQLVARVAIDKVVDERPTFSQLYIASSPYRRELFGYYPAIIGLGRFVLESHVSSSAAPDCSDERCGVVLYDRGFVKVNGFMAREEFAEPDIAYEWVAATLDRIASRTEGNNPLIDQQALEYLADMHVNGHYFMEEHNRIEAGYALEGNALLAEVPAEPVSYKNSMRR